MSNAAAFVVGTAVRSHVNYWRVRKGDIGVVKKGPLLDPSTKKLYVTIRWCHLDDKNSDNDCGWWLFPMKDITGNSMLVNIVDNLEIIRTSIAVPDERKYLEALTNAAGHN